MTERQFDDDGQPLHKYMSKKISAKQIAKYGEQKKHEGIKFMQLHDDGSILYARGDNIVQNFDGEKIVKTQKYDCEIKAVIGDIIISKTGDIYQNQKPSFKVTMHEKGNAVCGARFDDKLAVGSKNQVVQVWDVNQKKQMWIGRNLAHDELELPIPIWDTDMVWLNSHSLLACTAYSDVREYDTRGPRKPVIAAKVFGDQSGKDRYQQREMYLSKVL